MKCKTLFTVGCCLFCGIVTAHSSSVGVSQDAKYLGEVIFFSVAWIAVVIGELKP
jgi:hypothetical protein